MNRQTSTRLPALLLGCIFCFLSTTPAQNPRYLLIRFEKAYDNTQQRNFYTLLAEAGANEEEEVYLLQKYDPRRNATNTAAKLYFENKRTTQSLYNYFISPTEGLNYMARNGWALLSVFTEIASGSTSETGGNGHLVPITTVSSKTVYCLKR